MQEAKVPFKEIAEKEIPNCNILKVKVGTTGYCGGDAGHGCHSFIMLTNRSSTDWKATVKSDPGGDVQSIRIDLFGDSELETIIEALRFAADNLERTANK